MLSKGEVDKVNDLYKQVDVLTAENTALKSHSQCHDDISVQLTAIEDKLDKLLKKK
jgi:hypothetical protein